MAKMKKVEEDLEEIKHSLNSLTSEIEKVSNEVDDDRWSTKSKN